jgi:hypothetical protein
MKAMLDAAAGTVPADTMRTTRTTPKKKKDGPVWRTAGPKATETGAQSVLVYWKH